MNNLNLTKTKFTLALGKLKQVLNKSGIKSYQEYDFYILTIIEECELELMDKSQKLHMGYVANKLGISHSAMSKNCKRLEKKGWIERKTVLPDLRKKYLYLTETGKNEILRIQNEPNQISDKVIQKIGMEKTEELIQLMNSLIYQQSEE